ncbi:MAG: hypothetical protein ACRDJK_03100, partial [Actinomycetota bacterium]
MRSGLMPWSSKAASIPTSWAPMWPPPPNTNATFRPDEAPPLRIPGHPRAMIGRAVRCTWRRSGSIVVRMSVTAFMETAGILDRSKRVKMTATGDQALWFLDQLVTNQVVNLEAGQGLEAMLLTHR